MTRRPTMTVWLTMLALLCIASAAAGSESVDPALQAAVTTYRQDGPEKTLPEFMRLAAKYAAAGQRLDEAVALNYVGECYWRLGDFDRARTYLERALALKRALGDPREEAKTLNVLGLLDWDLGNYDQAIAMFRSARAAGRTLDDARLEGAALNNLSLVYDELGDYETSLEQYHQVLELYSRIDFPRGRGDTLGNIGGVFLLVGRYREALGYYEQALAISTDLEATPSMSQDHGNIALCHLGLGEIDTALEHFAKAIELSEQSGMRQDQAYWLRGAGNALIRRGLYDQGLDNYRTALAIYEDVGARAEHLETLHDFGRLHLLLGDAASAEQDFEQAIALAREIGLARGITQNLVALGDLLFRRQQYEAAAALYEQARRRAAETGEQGHLVESLLRLALAHREQSRLDEAAVEAGRALGIAREIGAQPFVAEALYATAELERRRGRPEAALSGFSAAAKTLAPTGDPEIGWQIHFGQALALEALGNKTDAVESLIAAVKLIEGVRARLKEDRFRAGYVQDKYQVYVELVRLQLELGRIEDAFSSAERLRARSYAALIDRGGAITLTAEEQRRENELRERIRVLQESLAEERARAQPEQRQMAIASFSSELLTAERDYQAMLDDRSSGALNETTASAIPGSGDVRIRLGDDQALLEYVVGERSVTAFVLTSHDIHAIVTPVRRVDLESRVALLRNLIRRPDDDRWQKPAAALSETLIEPLHQAGWLDEIRHVFVVPHGTLNYLPFALLPEGDADQRLLLERYTFVYLPTAAALMHETSGTDGPSSLLALAPARSRLRHAPDEARSIDALFQPNSRLLVGDVATESRFKTLAGDFRVLHLATHGYFNKLNPLLSGLELEPDDANDGLLEVHEVLDLELDADLVTLSACQTALGSGYFAEVPAGDEFVGLTRAFLSVGSQSVLATLWEVDDQSSVQLMQRFYEGLSTAGAGIDKSLALAAAQRELRSTEAFAHPYYWAPFVLVGALGHEPEKTLRVSEVTL